MLLDLSRALKEPGQVIPVDAQIALEPLEVLDDVVSFESVSLKGEMTGAGESVELDATARATVHTRCSRCLTDVSFFIEAEIDEILTRGECADDPDRYPIDGTKVDIKPIVQDALLLVLPMRFLCKEDCPGLCPTCGEDLNKGRCTCQRSESADDTPARKFPFSALSELLKENEEV